MDDNDPVPSSTHSQHHTVSIDPPSASIQSGMDTVDSSVDDQLKSIDDQKRIAQLEHEIFTVCKQLDEKSVKFKEVQEQNALLKERLGSLEHEKLERSQFVESLVKGRDDLIQEKTELQNDRLSLEKRKDELEMQVSKLTNDKRRHLDDIDQLRKKYDTLFGERTDLQLQIDEFKSEKALIAYDKEQWSREKEILMMSKQWYMNEIADREQKINEFRIQLVKEKAEMQREVSLLDERNNDLTFKTEQLSENLNERENELALLREQFKQSLNDQTVRMNELEAELRARERLTSVYKANSEAANNEITELNENEIRLQAQIKETEQVTKNLTSEIERMTNEHKKVVEEKDEEIKRLTSEVSKSTELLNAGFRLNRADEELVRLSPAAAAASSLLKSGMSLTAIYAEHCRVVSELDKKNDEFKQLERYVTELIEELDSKAPKFQEQRNAYEQMCERNECLRLQNDLLGRERQKLQASTDSLNRELTFTKRELERYQREHHLLTIQVQRLLYIVEKGPEALEHGGMNGDGASDEYLFSNIRELHTKNIELAEELERLHENQDKIIENYHNTEIDMLKQSSQQAQEELRLLRENYAKQELLIRELTEQREQYRQLYEQQNATPATAMIGGSSNASSVSMDAAAQSVQKRRESIDTLQSELTMWKMKADRLQETLAFFNEDRQTNEKTLNGRIDQQLEQISSMRTTIGKLESDLEFQNKNQQLLAKQIDSYSLDLKRSNDALSDAKRQLETLQFKYDSLTNQILEKQQELSTLKVQNYSLNEQLAITQSREQQSKKELEILRAARYNNERMALTLQEVEVVLKRVEAEKTFASESQLQSALLERDNLRQLVDNLNEQHSQLVNGLKANLNQACSDRDKAFAEIKALQSNMNALDSVYQRLKSDHEKLREENEQIQSTDTNVEACKKEAQKLRNTVAYQEKQLSEWEQKCEELNHCVERKDKQMEDMCRLGADLENSIEYGTLERQRMQAIREQLEKDLAISKKTIEELRNELASKEMELMEQSKLLSESNNQLEELRAKYGLTQMELEKSVHETQLRLAQCQVELEKLQHSFDESSSKCAELSENNLRLTTELAREIQKTEALQQKMDNLNSEFNGEREKLQQHMHILEQEKLHLNDEIKSYMKRDEEHVEKQNLYLDEIQKLVQQNSFMERLNQTIGGSPGSNTSLNASFNVGTPTTSRLSADTTTNQQQQNDRMSTIIGYMRSEKQKETELRMHAELELQRIRTQTLVDQQKIVKLEADVSKLQTEAEAGAKAAVEKDQLLAQLNTLREIQTRYQQLKKTFDDLNQRFSTLEVHTQQLEQEHITAQSEKQNLASRLDVLTKEVNTRTQENKNLRERYDKVMAIASKYSPELVNNLQGENEKLRSTVTQRDKELELLKPECERLGDELSTLKNDMTALKTKHDKTLQELQAVKSFARKFRDEKNTLDALNKKLEGVLKEKNEEMVRIRESATATEASVTAAESEARSAAPSTTVRMPGAIAAGALSAIRATAGGGANAGADNVRRRLQEQLMQVTKEKQELADKVKELEQRIEHLQAEVDEANEKVTRMDMVEKMLKASQKKVTDTNANVDRLHEENEQLRLRISELENQKAMLEQKAEELKLGADLIEQPTEDPKISEDIIEQLYKDEPTGDLSEAGLDIGEHSDEQIAQHEQLSTEELGEVGSTTVAESGDDLQMFEEDEVAVEGGDKNANEPVSVDDAVEAAIGKADEEEEELHLEVIDSKEEEDLMDEEEDLEDEEAEVYEDDEEGDEEEYEEEEDEGMNETDNSNPHDLEEGEPPLKQPRMQGHPPQDQGESQQDGKDADEDDDDDIQLL